MKKYCFLLLFAVICLLLSGCQSAPLSEVQENVTPVPTNTPRPLPTLNPNATWKEKVAYYKNAEEREGREVLFSAEEGFYSKDVVLELSAGKAKDIFYTDDGGEPGPQSLHYEHALTLTATNAELPKCAVIRAVAYYADGTKSPVETRVYFLNTGVSSRFITLIFSIVGTPDELTTGPSALLVGKRALDTGPYAKREVLLQAFESDGTKIIDQPVTLRVYGGDYSRSMPVKSLQLSAETEPILTYDAEPEEENPAEAVFAYPFFEIADASGETVPSYRLLTLSSGEDDFQYAFIRDELAQTMAKEAGFPDTEEVRPAVVYINGEYYGLHWLHNIIDANWLQVEYNPASGHYAVIDVSDGKVTALDSADQSAAKAFQEAYARLLTLNLWEDEAYGQLCQLLDVENYLDACVLNIYMDNQDWPAKARLYALVSDQGSAPTTVWRFLTHDMDRTFGWSQDKNAVRSDTLAEVLNPKSARYDPLFAKLMKRADCRAYFVAKMNALLETAFEAETAVATLNALHTTRNSEMKYYLSLIEKHRNVKNTAIWMQRKDYENDFYTLKNYVNVRPQAIQRALEANFTEQQEADVDAMTEAARNR